MQSHDPVRNDHCISYLELPVRDATQLSRIKQFYAAVFGWVYQDFGNAYANTHDSGMESGVSVDPPRTAQPLPVIYASNLEAALERVVAQNGAIIRETFEFPGGRRFQFIDPAGNEIGVWSDR